MQGQTQKQRQASAHVIPLAGREMSLPRLAVVGAGSGSGKTVITCAVLAALKNRGLFPVAYKAGPDYIDPMFHSRVLGVPSRNLDLFLCGEDSVKYLLAHNAQDSDIAIIEGVMGLYDGLGQGTDCSSNHLACLTHTPEILVVTPKGQGISLVAQLYGYKHFLPNTIKGVIFNQTSEKMHSYYRAMVEEHLGLHSFGYLPALPQGRFESRSLGLAVPETIEGFQDQLTKLAEAAEQSLDIDGLLELAKRSAPLQYSPFAVSTVANVTLGIAQDEAFRFYYEDSLDLLRRLGAHIVPFSPLHDAALPAYLDGILLGGGFPEQFARQLGENDHLKTSLRDAVHKGLPLMAEGGGFLYLCQELVTADNEMFPMTGILEAKGQMRPSLQRFGYCTLTATSDTLVSRKGQTINAHEYHYGDTSDNGRSFVAQKANGSSWSCIHATDTLFAGFPHIHLWGNSDAAVKFIQACAQYGGRQTTWQKP